MNNMTGRCGDLDDRRNGRPNAHDDGQQKQADHQPGRDDDRQRSRRGQLHDDLADQRGEEKPMTALSNAWQTITRYIAEEPIRRQLFRCSFSCSHRESSDNDGTDDHACGGACEEAAPAPALNSQNLRLRSRNSAGVSTSTSLMFDIN
jgi:hypothetical protein